MFARLLKNVFVLWTLIVCIGPLPAQSLVKLDKESIDLALKYGMQNQGMGYNTLLGPNWIEGPNGALLNIYTPFMLIAARSYGGGFSRNPSKDDITEARKRYARLITRLKDPKNIQTIKFSVALFGDSPTFSTAYTARIEGFGRGRNFVLKPSKVIVPPEATLDSGTKLHPYESINAYYFKYEDVALLDDYRLILGGPGTEPVVFSIKNDRIY